MIDYKMAVEQGELNIETKLDGALIIKNDVNNKQLV